MFKAIVPHASDLLENEMRALKFPTEGHIDHNLRHHDVRYPSPPTQ